jgi:hypothetical protein
MAKPTESSLCVVCHGPLKEAYLWPPENKTRVCEDCMFRMSEMVVED